MVPVDKKFRCIETVIFSLSMELLSNESEFNGTPPFMHLLDLNQFSSTFH